MKFLKNQAGQDVAVLGGESVDVICSFTHNGTPIVKTAIASIAITLTDLATGDVINSREDQDVLDANGATVTDAGVLTIRLEPADTAIHGTIPAGRSEVRLIVVTWTWNDGTRDRTGKEQLAFKVTAI